MTTLTQEQLRMLLSIAFGLAANDPFEPNSKMELCLALASKPSDLSWNVGKIPMPTGDAILIVQTEESVEVLESYYHVSPDESRYPSMGWAWPFCTGIPLNGITSKWGDRYTRRWCMIHTSALT